MIISRSRPGLFTDSFAAVMCSDLRISTVALNGSDEELGLNREKEFGEQGPGDELPLDRPLDIGVLGGEVWLGASCACGRPNIWPMVRGVTVPGVSGI